MAEVPPELLVQLLKSMVEGGGLIRGSANQHQGNFYSSSTAGNVYDTEPDAIFDSLKPRIELLMDEMLRKQANDTKAEFREQFQVIFSAFKVEILDAVREEMANATRNALGASFKADIIASIKSEIISAVKAELRTNSIYPTPPAISESSKGRQVGSSDDFAEPTTTANQNKRQRNPSEVNTEPRTPQRRRILKTSRTNSEAYSDSKEQVAIVQQQRQFITPRPRQTLLQQPASLPNPKQQTNYVWVEVYIGHYQKPKSYLGFGGLPMSIQKAILDADKTTTETYSHRKESVRANQCGKGICWMSVHKKLDVFWEPDGYSDNSECTMCRVRRRDGQDSACFYFKNESVVMLCRPQSD
ncbi:hypothetical protein HYFRA_00001990 [Hymenoscyphus fraxineus]|uniref:Uncharacterized protein n=1 Tax=Hymenoscyphus fraxineus TaxID=746836 RepID=A0A9N9KNS9_9HELO|nr:hypothetical protein HYFRA_00001990 [Hymenoscyphus fraxineus]